MATETPFIAPPGGRRAASVAAIFADADEGPELLLLRRSQRADDPWSGHIAFPGGRIDLEDDGPKAAAERETLEEVGLDLSDAISVGRLSDVCGAGRPIVISAFVYRLPERRPLTPDPREVAHAWWQPVAGLLDPTRRRRHDFCWEGRPWPAPAIDLLGPGGPLLWGLTYHFITEIMARVGHALPRHRRPDRR